MIFLKLVASALLTLLVLTQANAQVNLSSSNLPICVVNSINGNIPDEPKIPGTFTLYYNSDGSRNFPLDDLPLFTHRIGIELRGQTSLVLFDKKSYGVEFRDDLGEDENVEFLGFPEESDFVLHGPFSDKTLMRNALAYHFAGLMMDYAPRIRFVELIVDNDYKGVYLMTEKIKRDKNRVDISNLREEDNEGDQLTGGYILKFDKGDVEEIGWSSPYSTFADRPAQFLLVDPKWDEITSQQRNYIESWMTEFEDVLNSDEFTDEQVGYAKYIDVESFIDYMLVNELSRNVDAYRISTFMYKDRDTFDGKLHMGPVWDYNLGFGNADYCEGANLQTWSYNFNSYCPGDFWTNHFWWKRLLEDTSYQSKMTNRWKTLREGELSDAAVCGVIDSFSLLLEESQQRNFTRWNILDQHVWPNPVVLGTWPNEVDRLKSWLLQRMAWMDMSLTSVKGSSPKKDGIEIIPNPTSDVFTLRSDNVLGGQLYEIYNESGQLVVSGTYNPLSSIDVRSLNAGSYIFKIKSSQGALHSKFIKI